MTWTGQPVDRADTVMGNYYDAQAIAYKFPPFNPDSLIATKGYVELDNELNIAAVSSPLSIVRTAVLRKGVHVLPAVTDPNEGDRFVRAKQIAEHLAYDLNHMKGQHGNPQSFRSVVWELLYAVHVGFRVCELVWGYCQEGPYRGYWCPVRIAPKPAQQIGFELDESTFEIQSLVSYTPMTGYKRGVPVEKCLIYTFAPQDGLPYGKGVGRTVYKHSWSIDFLLKFWNLGLEIFGSPFLIGHAPPNAMAQALDVLKKLRQGATAVLPTGVEAQLMQLSSGGLDGFEKAVSWHEKQCLMSYLHNTLASSEGRKSGSLAQAQVHQDTQEMGLAHIRGDIEDVLNMQFVARWYRYNYGLDESLCPTITLGNWDQADTNALATAFSTLVNAAIVHPLEPILRERLQLPPVDPALREALEEHAEQVLVKGGMAPTSSQDSEEETDE